MALFLFACQPRSTRSPTKATQTRSDAFSVAEKYRQKGDLAQSLTYYQSFLTQAVKDDRIPLALQRIAEIELKLNNPENALASLEKLSRGYPDYTWMPEVRYQISVILYQLGRYEASASKAMGWLDQYPRHFLKKDVLVLLGDDFCAMGKTESAFFYWIQAKDAEKDDEEKETALDEKLKTLIDTSSPLLLSRLLENDREAFYPPEIYYQISSAFLSQKEPDQAEKAVQLLMESTRNLQWIKKGEDLLARIKEEMAICKSCIGCLLPLSGSFAAYGQEVLNGLTLGMMNDPMKETKMKVIVKDTAGSPEKALRELETLANKQRVIGIMGPLSSKTTAFISERAQDLGVPMIALTQKRDVVKTGDMVFRNFLTPAQEIDSLLEVAMGQLGLKRFGILYPDNTYGRFCMNRFWDKLDELGGSVTAVESYPTDVSDFEEQIKKMVGLYYPRAGDWRRIYSQGTTAGADESEKQLKDDDPIIDFDAVFIPDTYQRVAMIAPQLAFYDVLGVRLMGTRLWHSPKLIEMAGNYLQGALFSSGFLLESENPEVTGFVADYQNNFNQPPGILAANGYDTICLLQTVLREYHPKTREHLRQALLDIPAFEGVTGPFRFDEEGEALKAPLLLTVSGNKMVPIY